MLLLMRLTYFSRPFKERIGMNTHEPFKNIFIRIFCLNE